MASTANYNLTLYGTNDTETKHLTFRTTLAGDYEGSNMSIIDRVLKEHADEIDVLKDSPAVITVPATQVIENYYEANNIEGISEYITDMIIVLSIDSRNLGASTLQINSLGSKNILKYDTAEGTLTTIEQFDLPYTTLLKYNGESWVVVGDCWATPFTKITEDLGNIQDRISNIDNTSDMDKPISTAVSLALEDKIDTSVFSDYGGSAYGIVAKADIASTAESIQWDNIQDTPTEFTPKQIGGTQLLKNTMFEGDYEQDWEFFNMEVILADDVNGRLTVRATATENFGIKSKNRSIGIYDNTNPIIPVTLSFWVRATNSESNGFNLFVGGANKTIQITNGWKKHVFTYDVDSGRSLFVILRSIDGQTYISESFSFILSRIKLEVGETATDYSLSVADTVTQPQLDTVIGDINATIGDINSLLDNINGEVV